MPTAPTNWSGPSWFRRRRWLVLVAGCVLLALVAALAVRWLESRRAVRPDLGPGPVRGVRLTRALPGELDLACPGVAPDQPVVRLVEQVQVEQITVCLGPGRRPWSGQGQLDAYALAEDDGEQAAELLDAWAAAWSLPDPPRRWWRGGREEAACPATGAAVPPVSITVAGVTLRPVPPGTRCQVLEPAAAVMVEIGRAARPRT